MKTTLMFPHTLLIGVLMLGAVADTAEAGSGLNDPVAYATAVQAAIYGFAPEGMLQRLSAEVIDPATRKAGFNEYFHYTTLATPKVSPFRAPNNDTLYSTAWLDLRTQPAIFRMPDTNGRYYTAHVMDLTTETIANIGQRVYGTEAGLFAIIGPGWQGQLPPGIKAVLRSNTVFATVLLRVLVDGTEDVANVVALQRQFTIASLSRYLAGQEGSDLRSSESLAPYKPSDVSGRYRGFDRILRMNPVKPGEEALVNQFATIGLGPGTVLDRHAPEPELLEQAYADALTAIQAAGKTSGRMVNGWLVLSEGIGTYGFDYMQRASVWAGGPLANVPEESLYPSALTDEQGQMLNANGNRYTLRFAKGQIPPVNAFWSVTMYQMSDGGLTANSINRYSIGNRTPGLQYDQDGSLTLYIQHASPGADLEPNWLPAPEAPFYMVLRLYGPTPDVVSGRWIPPPIHRQR